MRIPASNGAAAFTAANASTAIERMSVNTAAARMVLDRTVSCLFKCNFPGGYVVMVHLPVHAAAACSSVDEQRSSNREADGVVNVVSA